MQKQARPIVIFDSGVGGLSIYQEVKRKLPGLKVVYCSDTMGFPYGPKPEQEVIERTSHCLNRLYQIYHPALMVIACNTASTISLPRVRQELNIPVVGVVPAIKTASEHSLNRCIGLLATPGTIARDYTEQLIRQHASDCHVIKVGSSELVQLAEAFLRGGVVSQETLQNIIQPFFNGRHQPDTIVLGCTHFPLLCDQLQAASPCQINWLDSGEAIARRVETLLGSHDLIQDDQDIFVYTGDSTSIDRLKPVLESMNLRQSEMSL